MVKRYKTIQKFHLLWWRIFILVSSPQMKRKSVTIQRQETIRSTKETIRSRDISGLSKLAHMLIFLSFFTSVTTMNIFTVGNGGFNQPLNFFKLHFTNSKVASRWRVNGIFKCRVNQETNWQGAEINSALSPTWWCQN